MSLYWNEIRIDGGRMANITDDVKKLIFDSIFPIDTICTTLANNPPKITLSTGSTYGTWTQITDERFLLGKTSDIGNTGGEATHTLTEAEMPKHRHGKGTLNLGGTLEGWVSSYNAQWKQQNGLFTTAGSTKSYCAGTGSGIKPDVGAIDDQYFDSTYGSWSGNTGEIGNNIAHDNTPPYINVYMWKRVSD